MDIHQAVPKVRIVAEIGSNYNGDLGIAVEYVRASQKAGANAVKFQTLRKDKLVAPRIWSGGQWIENPVRMNFPNLELPDEWHYALKKAADEVGVEFFSTPFYLEAVDLLEAVGVSTYKVASGDITFLPLLRRIGSTGKSVILSTGASSFGDVERALDVLVKAGAGDVVLLHCVSNYPPQWEEMNLRVIQTLQKHFNLPIGISDHTPGTMVPIAAVALGASVIEKHVTFDRSQRGPDHPFAMTMEEFAVMVEQVRLVEQALGTGEKIPTPAEQAKQARMRRGTYDPITLDPVSDASGIWLRPQHSG